MEFYFESESVDPTRPNSYCTEAGVAWGLTAEWRLEADEELTDNITFQYIENGAALDMASVDLYSGMIMTYNAYEHHALRQQIAILNTIGDGSFTLWFDQKYDTDFYGNIDSAVDGTQFRVLFYYWGWAQGSAKRVKRANGAANTATADTTSADAMAADTTTADAMAADTSAADAMAADTSTADAMAADTTAANTAAADTTAGDITDGDTAATDTAAAEATSSSEVSDTTAADGATADGAIVDGTTAVSQETHTMDTVTVEESDHVTSDAAQTTEATGHHTEDIAMSTVAAITHDNALSLTTQDDGDGVNIISVDLTIREAVCKS